MEENQETVVQLPVRTRVTNFVRKHKFAIAMAATTTGVLAVNLYTNKVALDNMDDSNEDLYTIPEDETAEEI